MSNFDCLGMNYRQQRNYKESIRKRDNYTCQLCGNPGRDVDHIIPFHISCNSSPSNLRVLCHSCNLIGRRYTLPEGKRKRIAIADWYAYLERELLKEGLTNA